MRSFRVCFIAFFLFAAATVNSVDGSIVHGSAAPQIELYIAGSINQASLTTTINGGALDITAPAGTLTTTAMWMASCPTCPLNNIGLSTGDTLSFAGGTFNSLTTSVAAMSVPSLVTFTTPQGTFTFSSLMAQADVSSFPNSTGQNMLAMAGRLTEASNAFAPTFAVFALFYNPGTGQFPDGQFPIGFGQGAAWALATQNSSVPEPTAGCVWCLMAAGALAYRRRWAN